MDEKRLIELIARKLAGEATREELLELKELSSRYQEAGDTEKLLTHIWEKKDHEEDGSSFYDRHHARHADIFNTTDEPSNRESLAPSKKRYVLPVTLVFILFSAFATYLFFDDQSTEVPAGSLSQIVSGKGIRKSVKLPDGSTVFLNADSRISFHSNMNDENERIVSLSGEAYFDVAHRAKQPFIIHTSTVSIRVLGTAFNVKAYPSEKKCETTLIRGSIELSLNAAGHQKFLMKPSEKLTVSYENNEKASSTDAQDKSIPRSTLLIENVEPVMVANKAFVAETSWTENRLIFENESFEELAPKFERWYNVQILIKGDSLRALRFTGAFANESFVQALTAMKLIKPFNFTVHGNNITIY